MPSPMARRIARRRFRERFWEVFWELPGLSWIADDCLTAILCYLAILAMLGLLGEVVWIGFQRGAF